MTTKEAAKKLNRTRIWIQKLCQRHNIGTLVNEKCRILDDEDFKKLEAIIYGGK